MSRLLLARSSITILQFSDLILIIPEIDWKSLKRKELPKDFP
jgi:hypothetical protein